jgi:2-haloalkanoic acid dehalogenase type II
MRLTQFKALSFDCYGTLIDWESGIVTALQPLVARSGVHLTQDDVLEIFARHESPAQQESPGALYPEILAKVYDRIAQDWGMEADRGEKERFISSVSAWPAFSDSQKALQYLKSHYKLVILSNIDRQTFAASNERLAVKFDHIYTAQDIGSYKPDRRNFVYLIEHLAEEGIAKEYILHTAESLYHDHLPANDIGLASAWINRRHGRQGLGATHPPPRMPNYNFKFNSLAEMMEAHRKESADEEMRLQQPDRGQM